ncbi:N-(5'-phosphoribosyl)anthranilate isomerase [Rhodoplanes elegans]|uniref:N-(5'-phosphoribosyl)anthranilate isomerase n=1 Tax=Rhodoplanes elegans TaxID=29408 RepID=A0A327KAH6_9BRAD|nr:phosphoribosylanthranilate isomerase [Rhodoplanes elegans]MBK5961049.1 N-(5'-phosphoribosyl)anthranilate isomerase [Rhodoplanes elegans]RAI35151.1 N-(5'-phosphoribosyl)anthranilate isomerase [Rhodoplanes elegans]
MRTRIKVCCISSVEEARMAIAAGASALGFVAAMPSGPGVIADDRIAEIAGAVPPPVSRFLLTSRTAPADVVAHVAACRVDTVQLVDAVPVDTYAALRRELPHVRIVQVLHVEGSDAVAQARAVAPLVDAILLDSGRPSAALRELGGTGRVHDWAISRDVVSAVAGTPVFLAGGLGPDNVGAAIRMVRPFGIDLCSGVRIGTRLDAAALARLVAQVGAADAGLGDAAIESCRSALECRC